MDLMYVRRDSGLGVGTRRSRDPDPRSEPLSTDPAHPGELFHKVAIYWSAVRAQKDATKERRQDVPGDRVAKKPRSFSFSRSAQSLQENVARSGPVAGAAYTLVG